MQQAVRHQRAIQTSPSKDWATSFEASDYSSTFFTGVAVLGLLFDGSASADDMIAGSTGAPGTVACPVGGRIAGGVYLFAPPEGSGFSTP